MIVVPLSPNAHPCPPPPPPAVIIPLKWLYSRKKQQLPVDLEISFILVSGYAFAFTSTGGTDAVSLSGTPDRALTELTICLWMKTNQSSDTNGTPLSYTADGRKNEIAINDYKNFNLKIGRSNVGYAAIFFSLFHSTFFNCIQTEKGPKLEKIRNNLSPPA